MVNQLIEKIKNTITKHSLIYKGDKIVVGLSGGPDSVCLLSILKELSDEWQLSLHAVHINHSLRGKDADEDQLYTENLCERFGIPCHVFRYDVNKLSEELKITTEEAGRRVRYESFERIRTQIEESESPAAKAKIAVAHNMNDQAETLLMRIIRGTGTEGLAGMEYMRDGVIIRPLLDVTRDEIEEYCEKKNLNPRIDLTNLEPLYARNRLRLELLPLLQKNYNTNILSSLNRLARIAAEDRDYFNFQIERIKNIARHDEKFTACRINRKAYSELHPAIGKRLILSSLKEMGMHQDMTAVHLDASDELFRIGKTGDRIDLPWNYSLVLGYEDGTLYKKLMETDNLSQRDEAIDFAYPLTINDTIDIVELNAKLRSTIIKQDIKQDSPGDYSHIKPLSPRGNPELSVCLDISRVPMPDKILIRNKRPGDYIMPLGMKGRKKLQDFFVDNKIPREKRGSTPLLCYGNEVLWIVGLRINEQYKITERTKEMLCLEYVEPS